jgi:hypothetical protein
VQEIKDRLTVENAARQTLAQIIVGAVLMAGLFFTWENLKITQETATKSQETATKDQEISREGQITDRFTKAIAQLGDDKLQIRLGGIYALERIARDSEKDHVPIMEVLTACVRENTPRKERQASKQEASSPSETQPTASNTPLPLPAADIQAVLTVLGRRTRTFNHGESQRLDLTGADLRRAFLRGAHLEGADLAEARLERAVLAEAHMEGANLWRARLEGADLWKAHLEGANLKGTHLEEARPWEAHLKRVYNLAVDQLCTAATLHKAHIDPPLIEQIQQTCPQLLEEPRH